MNKASKILSLAIASLLVASAATAATSYERTYVENYKGRTDIPVPVSVVTPTLTSTHETARVVVTFTVDEKGKPRNIAVNSAVDRELSESLTSAVAEWKFAPALSNGTPVAREVVLPMLIN